jgi:hypothetical protein
MKLQDLQIAGDILNNLATFNIWETILLYWN